MDKIRKIVRTFHPVGQGAFYSERFYDDSGNVTNVVFDCGVEDVGERHKKVVRGNFIEDDAIQYLFISHLDNDHISLVKTLKEAVGGKIWNVVLPYIDRESVALQYSLSLISGDSNVWSFWRGLKDVQDGVSTEGSETRYHFIGDERDNDLPERWNVQLHNSGESFSLGNYSNEDWVFIPFVHYPERKDKLDEHLTPLLTDNQFQKEVEGLGLTITSLKDLKLALIKDTFADLINNQVIKKKLHDAYCGITGTINQNSLIVYSGPSIKYDSKDHAFLDEGFVPRYYPGLYYHVACIYTGDSDFDITSYKNHLGKLWNNVGTIQIPHHGSLDSFKIDKNHDKLPSHIAFPVSCGEVNKYGHPSGKVLSLLCAERNYPFIVTEQCSTIYIQLFMRCHS